MADKYEIKVEGREKPLYSGDNLITAGVLYHMTVRQSAFGTDKEIVGKVITIYENGKLLEQYQPLSRRV